MRSDPLPLSSPSLFDHPFLTIPASMVPIDGPLSMVPAHHGAIAQTPPTEAAAPWI